MKLIALLCAAAAAATLAATASPASSAPSRSDPWAYRYEVPPLQRFVPVADIVNARTAVWTCQRKVGVPLTQPGLTPGELHRAGHPFRAWIVAKWGHRLNDCRNVAARTMTDPGEWTSAVNLVQRAFPGSGWWLLACSSSEGGWGGFVWLGHDSSPRYGDQTTPGGWMQYMQRTFWGDFNSAAADMAARGFRLAPSAASYYSPLGQAVAAGWAYSHARPSGKWTGYRC